MKNEDPTNATFRAMRELVIAADPESLTAAIQDAGIDPKELARSGRAVVARALARVAEESASTQASDLHEGLSALLQLLRRRDNLSYEQLAQRARVDVDEIKSIENDPAFTAGPRTIYQLEHYFKLPKRSLAKLAGMTRHQSSDFREEVLRFAAHSKTMHKLTRDETRILNAFVKFLGKDAEADEK
ncbi:MAG TPA: helix-turn-helix transcriptional regulator [Thermoanaerobaculia bacterium]